MKRLTALLLVCASAALGLAACGDDDSDNNDSTSATTGTTGTTGAGGASGASGATGKGDGGGSGTLKVAADPSGALEFTEDTLTAKAGKVKIDFTNDSSVPHNVSIEEGGKEIGATEVVTNADAASTVTLKAGEYTYYCEVDGHEQAGMKGTLTVK